MPFVANPVQKPKRKARILLGSKAGMRTKILRDMPEARAPPNDGVTRLQQCTGDHRIAKRPHIAIDPGNRLTHINHPGGHDSNFKYFSSDADRERIRPTYPAACEDRPEHEYPVAPSEHKATHPPRRIHEPRSPCSGCDSAATKLF
jgi:YD repeat-containing protein